jgi:mannose-6-phosphate isomerase
VKPLRLPANQLHRFYRGGEAIARFRGTQSTDEYGPEDWVGSTSTIFGEAEAGLSRLEDGRLVRDAVAADPDGFLGPGRTSPDLLVKLLDAGERLPVHCHPDRSFAARELGLRYGKTEAWAIVETRVEHPLVGLGFREDVDDGELADWVERQDVEALLRSLNELTVAAGDVVFVPAGVPHAIGEGILMVELQEPSDLSVLLEWEGFALDGRSEGSLGLGWDVALAAVDRSAWAGERVAALHRATPDGERVPLLPAGAAPFFGGERLRPAGTLELEPSFAILVVLAGPGRIECAGGSVDLARGDTLLVPHGAGSCTVTGELDMIRCLPPEAGRG